MPAIQTGECQASAWISSPASADANRHEVDALVGRSAQKGVREKTSAICTWHPTARSATHWSAWINKPKDLPQTESALVGNSLITGIEQKNSLHRKLSRKAAVGKIELHSMIKDGIFLFLPGMSVELLHGCFTQSAAHLLRPQYEGRANFMSRQMRSREGAVVEAPAAYTPQTWDYAH